MTNTNYQPDANRPGRPAQWKSESKHFANKLSAVPPGTAPSVFTRFLGELARSHHWWDVELVFDEMKRRSIQSNRIHMNAAINVYARCGRPETAEQWLKTMGKDGMEPNTVTYNSVVNACAQTGDLQRAEHWLRCMVAMALNRT